MLGLLSKNDLLKGKTIGVDATTLEANAALRSIVRRDDFRSYQEFLTDLAKASGIPTPTREDLGRPTPRGSHRRYCPDPALSRPRQGFDLWRRLPSAHPGTRDPSPRHAVETGLLGGSGRGRRLRNAPLSGASPLKRPILAKSVQQALSGADPVSTVAGTLGRVVSTMRIEDSSAAVGIRSLRKMISVALVKARDVWVR